MVVVLRRQTVFEVWGDGVLLWASEPLAVTKVGHETALSVGVEGHSHVQQST